MFDCREKLTTPGDQNEAFDICSIEDCVSLWCTCKVLRTVLYFCGISVHYPLLFHKQAIANCFDGVRF